VSRIDRCGISLVAIIHTDLFVKVDCKKICSDNLLF
jgi:hypothetical protein